MVGNCTASEKFCASKINLAIGFTRKNQLEGCNDAVPWLNETTSRIFRPTANFENFEIHLYFVCQPAVRPGCARCRAPEISQNKGMAADLRKSYSEDDLPTAPWRFPLSFIPFLVFYIFLSKVRISPKVTIACNGFCLLRHTKTWLACDIISYSGTDVFACTLLHRELRDYSLGQIAFAVFRALFAITQLLCHVSALLTSACKQA